MKCFCVYSSFYFSVQMNRMIHFYQKRTWLEFRNKLDQLLRCDAQNIFCVPTLSGGSGGFFWKCSKNLSNFSPLVTSSLNDVKRLTYITIKPFKYLLVFDFNVPRDITPRGMFSSINTLHKLCKWRGHLASVKNKSKQKSLNSFSEQSTYGLTDERMKL